MSGFDLREFDRFAEVGVGGAGDGAGAGLSHPARLSDLRYEALPPPVLLGEVQVAGERRALPAEGAASWASGPVRPLREGVCHAVAVWVDALLPGGGGAPSSTGGGGRPPAGRPPSAGCRPAHAREAGPAGGNPDAVYAGAG